MQGTKEATEDSTIVTKATINLDHNNRIIVTLDKTKEDTSRIITVVIKEAITLAVPAVPVVPATDRKEAIATRATTTARVVDTAASRVTIWAVAMARLASSATIIQLIIVAANSHGIKIHKEAEVAEEEEAEEAEETTDSRAVALATGNKH